MTDRELLEAAARAVGQICYTPETGDMTWIPKSGEDQETRRWNSRYANMPAGCVDERGYVRVVVRIDGMKRAIRAHQLAWFITHGKLPQHEIDHINRVKSDNRISNLRDVPRAINQRNKGLQQNSSSGYVGVTRSRGRDKWEAYGRDAKRRVYLGLFDSPMQAAEIAKAFRQERGYSPTHGQRAAAAMKEG